MMIKFQYTTHEGGIWRDLYTDIEHETRIVQFVSGLSVPLPTNMTVITASMAGLPENFVVHSIRFHDGIEWDAKTGIRAHPLNPTGGDVYDNVYKDHDDGC